MVTVVILTQKRPSRVLMELECQTYRDFEIILANDSGIVNAMNKALANAKGDIFVRIDDDVCLPKEWLEELVKPFEDPLVCGVTGGTYVPRCFRNNRDSIRMVENPNWFLRWMFDGKPFDPARIYNCGSVSYGSNFPEKCTENYDIDHLEGTNWAVRTMLIKIVGGFDPKFDGVAEWFDDDVLFKIKRLTSVYKLKYNPKAYLWHLTEITTQTYDERFNGWGRIKNWLRFHWRHSRFHYKKVVWLCMMIAYFLMCLLSSRRTGVAKHSKD